MPDYEQVKKTLQAGDSGLLFLIVAIGVCCFIVSYLANRHAKLRMALSWQPPYIPLPHLPYMALILLLGLILRLPIMSQSLWYDEAFTARLASLPFDMLPNAVMNDVHPPGYYLLIWGWERLVGDSPLVLRLPSLAFGLLGIWLMYRMALVLDFNRHVALLAALLMAVLPAAIYYSTELRNYALFTCVIYGAVIAILEGRLRLLGILLALMPWLHNLGFIYALVIGLVALAGCVPRWSIGLGWCIGLLWMPFAIQQAQTIADGYWPYISPGSLFWPLIDMTIGKPQAGYSAFTVIPILALTLVSLWAARRWFYSHEGKIWLALVLGVPIIIAIISVLWRPLYVPRTFYPCMIALCIPWSWFLLKYRLSQVIVFPALVMALVSFYGYGSANTRVPYGELLKQHCAGATAIYYTSIPAAFVASANDPSLPGVAWPEADDDAGTFTPDDLPTYGFQTGDISLLSGHKVCIMQIDQPLTKQKERDYVNTLLAIYPHTSSRQHISRWHDLYFRRLTMPRLPFRSAMTCPNCKSLLSKKVKIDAGQVLCPVCDHLMFIYRFPGEDFTPAEFTKLLESRGKDAIDAVRNWFPNDRGKVTRLSSIEAGFFIAWMWPFLAQIFKSDDQPESVINGQRPTDD